MLLFRKLPQTAAERLAHRVAGWALGVTLPGVASEVGMMCAWATALLPNVMEAGLLQPLMATLREELGYAGASKAPSQALEAAIR